MDELHANYMQIERGYNSYFCNLLILSSERRTRTADLVIMKQQKRQVIVMDISILMRY